MHAYRAAIDGGQGGETTIQADTLDKAMAEAIEWARGGEWPEDGCDITVGVTRDDDEDEYDTQTVTILSTAQQQDEALDADGTVIAESEGEHSTERIILMDGEAYYTHPNGGSRGAWDRMDGDGVWRERPCSPTRKIERHEARTLMLDWGYHPAEVARLTRKITS